MAVNTGVVKLLPVNNKVPPEAASYQRYVPPGAVAVKVAELPEQIVVPDAVGAAGVAAAPTVTCCTVGGQPLSWSVTETVYVPGVVTEIDGVVAPVFHAYV